jgi:hypothetical protein
MSVTERQMANLRHFPKGVSGNPAGRKKGQFNMVTAVHTLAPKLIRRLAAIALKGEDKASIAAVRELLNRGYGLPASTLTVGGEVHHEHTHVLSREQLLAIASGQTTEAADDAGIEDAEFSDGAGDESGDNPEQDQPLAGCGGDARERAAQ